MAIGIRRDREGVMPGTLTFPAAAATGLEVGDIAKLSGGLLVKAAPGDVFDNAARWLVVGNYVSGITAPAGTNYDCTVIPLDDELTYQGAIAEVDTGDATALAVGDAIDVNATADGFQCSVSVPETDFIIVQFLDGEGTTTPTVEVVKA